MEFYSDLCVRPGLVCYGVSVQFLHPEKNKGLSKYISNVLEPVTLQSLLWT